MPNFPCSFHFFQSFSEYLEFFFRKQVDWSPGGHAPLLEVNLAVVRSMCR